MLYLQVSLEIVMLVSTFSSARILKPYFKIIEVTMKLHIKMF